MNVKEFFEKAKAEYGLGELIYRLDREAEGRRRAKWDIEFEAPRRDFLISPIIKEGDLSFLYATKGVGKTCLGMPMAYIVAIGGELFGLWKAPKPRTTLYIDGEGSDSGICLRKNSSRRQLSIPKGKKIPLLILSGRYNLYDPADRKFIESEIDRINALCPEDMKLSFIVLDNLTSMIGSQDKPELWDEFFTWSKELLNKGISLLVLFHANRGGMMRGSQMKPINADNLFYLEDPRLHGVSTKTPRGWKKSKAENLSSDHSVITIRVIPENLRNTDYMEAYTPIVVEFYPHNSTWKMPELEEYQRTVLTEQSTYLSDSEMAPFWGVPARQVKEMRRKYNIIKNKRRSPGQDREENEEYPEEEEDLEDEEYEDEE